MVQNIINLDEKEDRILNIIKAKFGFKNKSKAIGFLLKHYEEKHLENHLKPEHEKNAVAPKFEFRPRGNYIG